MEGNRSVSFDFPMLGQTLANIIFLGSNKIKTCPYSHFGKKAIIGAAVI